MQKRENPAIADGAVGLFDSALASAFPEHETEAKGDRAEQRWDDRRTVHPFLKRGKENSSQQADQENNSYRYCISRGMILGAKNAAYRTGFFGLILKHRGGKIFIFWQLNLVRHHATLLKKVYDNILGFRLSSDDDTVFTRIEIKSSIP
ncbi:hypothetical protein YH62_25520 [Rhizobium sp. LC145]|nr:hypothetical protein YH62_25520 [Rhizobium sp. LC145]